jgi:hypothetical protein
MRRAEEYELGVKKSLKKLNVNLEVKQTRAKKKARLGCVLVCQDIRKTLNDFDEGE